MTPDPELVDHHMMLALDAMGIPHDLAVDVLPSFGALAGFFNASVERGRTARIQFDVVEGHPIRYSLWDSSCFPPRRVHVPERPDTYEDDTP